jgi:hypothetical protein
MKTETAIRIGRCFICKKGLFSDKIFFREGHRKYCTPCHAELIEYRQIVTVKQRDRELVETVVEARHESDLDKLYRWIGQYRRMSPHKQLEVAMQMQRDWGMR